jgi:superfamily I DNA/RNA helicase
MRIVVAGAGAGKTTSMAQMVLARYKEITDQKIIYVITYTNAASDHIKKKIIELNGCIPKYIFIETLHSFLIKEFIFPFHHLLYDQQFNKVSLIKLPDNHMHKAYKIKELNNNNYIHVEKVTETAKWVTCGKTGDKKKVKTKREKILMIIKRYLDSIFIDEAQDMDKHFTDVIEVLDEVGINICLVGDPKQDLRGRNAFKGLIIAHKEDVIYHPENHRCAVSHVVLANSYISEEEQQTPESKELGKLSYALESKINIADLFYPKNWDHSYILKKNERFVTHTVDNAVADKNLSYELKSLVQKTSIKEKEIDKIVYYIKKNVIKDLKKISYSKIFHRLERFLSIRLTEQDRGKLSSAFTLVKEVPGEKGIVVKSIDSVKGLEGERCLFILTTDLANYLFRENTEQNKMLNYLYVALTRSKKELMILVTTEVEEKYGKDFIDSQFKELGFEGIFEKEKVSTV